VRHHRPEMSDLLWCGGAATVDAFVRALPPFTRLELAVMTDIHRKAVVRDPTTLLTLYVESGNAQGRIERCVPALIRPFAATVQASSIKVRDIEPRLMLTPFVVSVKTMLL